MDYTLAALKLFCVQLKNAVPTASQKAMTLSGILFQRAWLQGVLVSGKDEGSYILDDGSDVVELSLSNEFQGQQWKTGMYVMVIGVYAVHEGEFPVIKVHKIVDLSAQPDRDSMWNLEVIEAYKLFYQPSLDE